MKTIRYNILALFFILFFCFDNVYAQDFLPKLYNFQVIQKDTSNFHFKEVWIKSKDISSDNAYGYLRRAFEKMQLGYWTEAMEDIDKARAIDSTLAYIYTLKGYCKLSEDSVLSSISCFQKAIELDSSALENYFNIAQIYLRLSDFKRADSVYVECLKLDSGFYETYFGRANVAYMLGDPKRAKELYKKVTELNPEHFLSYFNLAVLYSRTFDTEKSIKYLNKAIQVKPDFAIAYYYRGYLKLSKTTNPKSTLKDWDKAVELDSMNFLFRLTRGLLLVNENQYKKGIEEIDRVIYLLNLNNNLDKFEKSPRTKRVFDFLNQLITYNQYSSSLSINQQNQIQKALALFYQQKYSQADIIYSELLKNSKNRGLIYYLSGNNQRYMGFSNSSVEYYRKALQQSEFPPDTYLQLADVFFESKNYTAAILFLDSFISKNDSSKVAYRSRGMSYLKVNQCDSAIMDFSKYLAIDSTEADIYYNRGTCYKALGDFKKAIEDFNMTINYGKNDLGTNVLISECKYFDGDTLGALNLLRKLFNKNWLTNEGKLLLGKIYLDFQKYDSAIIVFNNYIIYNNNDLVAYMFRAKAYYESNDFSNALDDYNAVLSRNKDYSDAWYGRGLVFIKLNKPDLAYKAFKQAELLENPNAKQAIEYFLKDYIPDE